nr:expansin-like B1 [Ipomoea batatas]
MGSCSCVLLHPKTYFLPKQPINHTRCKGKLQLSLWVWNMKKHQQCSSFKLLKPLYSSIVAGCWCLLLWDNGEALETDFILSHNAYAGLAKTIRARILFATRRLSTLDYEPDSCGHRQA